jgi:HK97 family phage portal protein
LAFWSKKTLTETTTTQGLLDFLNIGTVDKTRLSEATYFACLKILGETMGKLPLKLLQQTEKGGVVKAYKHPLFNIVGTRPNPYMTAAHFWSTVEYNRNHYGNAYVWIVGAGTKEQLWILPSDSVSVWVDNAGAWGKANAIWYVYNHVASGQQYKIPSDSIMHFRTSTSFDGITGKPVREILDDTLTGNQTAQQMLNKAYESGFTGKAVLQYTGEPSPANEKKYAQRIQDYLDGAEGMKDIIPVAYGTQLTPFSTKFADNEFLGLKRYSALQIAAAFGIKPNQINDYEKASYSAAEQQQLAFYVDTLLYILKQYEEELTYKLLSADEIANGFYFKFNVGVILRADQKTQLEALKEAVNGGIYTPNEARSFLDKEARPGGDELIVNGTMVKLTQVGAAYGAKTEGKEDDDG